MMRTWQATWQITIPSAVAKTDLQLDVLLANSTIVASKIHFGRRASSHAHARLAPPDDCLLPGL